MATTADKNIVELNWCDNHSQVVVTPSCEDRYVKSVKQVIAACQLQENNREAEEQFKLALDILGMWILNHAADINKAFVTVYNGQLQFVVIRKQVAYDKGFDSDLTTLDIDLAIDSTLDKLSFGVLALPKSSAAEYATFLNDAFLLEFKGINA